jgi:hypothetical protein
MTDEADDTLPIPQFLRRQPEPVHARLDPLPTQTRAYHLPEGPDDITIPPFPPIAEVEDQGLAPLAEFADKVMAKARDEFGIPGPEQIDWAKLEADATAHAIEELPRVMPFFMEHWPLALRALTVQTEILALASRERDDLLKIIEATMDEPRDPWSIPAAMTFAQIFEHMIKEAGGRAFVRLGSRSPKDNPVAMDGNCMPIPAYSGRQAVEFLAYSERVLEDLSNARRANYLPTICVRRWIDMEFDQEFRCFVEDGQIVGITQYYLDDGISPWIAKNERAIEGTLRDYLRNVIVPLSGLRSLTADIIMSRDMRPTLLEINPPVSWGKTFPGLFNNPRDFDGTFRFLPWPVPKRENGLVF